MKITINEAYQSPLEYLVEKHDCSANPFYNAIFSQNNFFYKYCDFFRKPYTRQSRAHTLPEYLKRHCLGSLQPVVDMYQDVIDTFKAYENSHDAKQDFLQPVIGLLHVARGILILPTAILLTVYNILIKNIPLANSFKEYFLSVGVELIRALSWVVDSCLSIIRGITQIATTPVTWFFKIPARTAMVALKELRTEKCPP